MEANADKISDTFTEDQIAEFSEAFKLFPREKDCIKSDSIQTLLRALGHNPSEEELNRIYKHLQIFPSTKVSFTLFLSVIAMLFAACSEESIRQAFRMFDKVS